MRFSFFVPLPLRSLLREAGFDRRELDALDFWLLLLLAAGFEDLLGAACFRLPDFCPLVDCFRPGEDFAFDTPRGLSASGLCRRDDRVWVVLVELPRLTVTWFREEFSLDALNEVTAGVSDSFFFLLLLGRVDDLSFMLGREALGGLERRGEDLTFAPEFVAGRLITLVDPGITACRPWPCVPLSRLPKKRNLSRLPGTRTT